MKTLASMLVGLSMLLSPVFAKGQATPPVTITIRLLNRHDGKPLRSVPVKIWPSRIGQPAIDLQTGLDGTAAFSPPAELTGFQLTARNPKDGWAFVSCDWNNAHFELYSVEEVVRKGIAARNRCNHRVATASPGELVLFMKPTSWLGKLPID